MGIRELKYPLVELKALIQKWLYIEDSEMIDVMLAVHVANQLRTDPLWLLFIAPPSHTKTELLRSFQNHENAYFLSNLTPATLVSGKATKNYNPSLLPKLDGKTLILKDFTTVLSMRSEAQQEVLSQLREVYDGFYSKAFGTGITIEWRGHIGLIGACTPVFDKHYAVLGALGDRFLLYRTQTNNTEKMAAQAYDILGQEEGMRREIQEAIHRFINQFDGLGSENIEFKNDLIIQEKIIALACFCAIARCPVERDKYTQALLYNPLPEGPPRLVKQFLQIGAGLALIQGKTSIDAEAFETIKHVGRDIISAQRLEILKHLWDEKVFSHRSKWLKTKEISTSVGKPTMTSKLILEDLMVVKLLNRVIDGEGETSPYQWQLNERAFDLMARSEIFT